MTSEDIIGGMKNAMARGSSLKDAMQSFYNAGYKKEDIEEAARKIQSQSEQIQQNQIIPQNKNNQVNQPTKSNQQLQQLIQNQPINNSSSYTGWIILLVGLLIITVSATLILIFFKDQVLNFLQK